jgi:hypothetical protein
MKAKTVFALEDGEYSDYHVIGIYTTKERAESVQKAVGGTIAEWELDPGWSEINKGLNVYLVWMLRDGTTERVDLQDVSSYSKERHRSGSHSLEGHSYLWQRTQASAYKRKGIPDCLNCTVWARNEKHAVKIANEKRVQMIANGEWK